MTLTLCTVLIVTTFCLICLIGIAGLAETPAAILLIAFAAAGLWSTGVLYDHATGRVTYEEHVAADGSRFWVRVRVAPATPVERSEP